MDDNAIVQHRVQMEIKCTSQRLHRIFGGREKKEELRLKKFHRSKIPDGKRPLCESSTMKIMTRQFLQSKDSLSWDNSKSVRTSSYQPHCTCYMLELLSNSHWIFN